MCQTSNPRKLDTCMVKVIEGLTWFIPKNEILACCCGHGRYSKTIIVKKKGWNCAFELLTNTPIHRKKKFYKRDSKGFFYIPEVDQTRTIAKLVKHLKPSR